MKIEQQITVEHDLSFLGGNTDPPSYRIKCGGCEGVHIFQARSKGMAEGYEWKCEACGCHFPLREHLEGLE